MITANSAGSAGAEFCGNRGSLSYEQFRTEVQITVAERYRRLIVSSHALCLTCPLFTPSSPFSARAFSTSSSNPDIWF